MFRFERNAGNLLWKFPFCLPAPFQFNYTNSPLLMTIPYGRISNTPLRNTIPDTPKPQGSTIDYLFLLDKSVFKLFAIQWLSNSTDLRINKENNSSDSIFSY